MQGAQKTESRGIYRNTVNDEVLLRNAADERFSTAAKKVFRSAV
jgi:hypothetical protein